MTLAIQPPADGAAAFLDALLAVERAWALLDDGEAEAALAAAPHSAQVVVRAAAMMPAERARALLEDGLGLDAAPAPLQLALARNLRDAGEVEAARRRFRAALLRARPDGALLVELAALEQQCGDSEAAGLMVAAAHALPSRDHDGLRAGAERLRALGRCDLALLAFAAAHQRGNRDPRLFAAYGEVLAERPDLSAFARLHHPALAASLRHLATLGLLSVGPDRAAVLADAAARERSGCWVSRQALPALLSRVVADARPFAWIRLGDGEARFLLAHEPALAGLVPVEAARGEADGIWRNWFGSPLADAPRPRIERLAIDLRRAAAEANLLGLTPHVRLAHDHYHFPYCALVERFAATLPPSDRLLTSANSAAELAEDDRFLGSILAGLDWIGVVGPHGDLAARLQAQLDIGASRTWQVPGETRLGRAEEDAHFPDGYDRVMATLELPRPGAVVLIAAGLLGKLYAARVRALGGVALDIGAVADAWMGINTRGVGFARLAAEALPPV